MGSFEIWLMGHTLVFFIQAVVLSGVIASLMMEINKFFSDDDYL